MKGSSTPTSAPCRNKPVLGNLRLRAFAGKRRSSIERGCVEFEPHVKARSFAL
jgi:hypothetical protein